MAPNVGLLRQMYMTHSFPVDRYGLIHRSAAHASGYTDHDLAVAVKCGRRIKVVRGIFAPAAPRTRREHHQLLAVATSLTSDGDKLLSHQSAAVLHGLEMLKPDLSRAHIITGHISGGRKDRQRHAHAGVVPDDERTEVHGIPVTSLERTAVDVACTSRMKFAGALAVFDSALRKGADPEKIAHLLRAKRHGAGFARRAFDYADPNAENPGESWGRAQMIEAGLPVPRLQHEFYDERGVRVARTDYDWDGRLVAEFDGKVKYCKHVRPGETAAEVVIREKKREDALRRMGVMVVRFVWTDLEQGLVAGMVYQWLKDLGMLQAA